MTLQEMIQVQDARLKAYYSDLDFVTRYGNGELMSRTVIVDFHKWFDEDMRVERLEIPTDVTIGQLMDLLAQVQPETFRDSWFLEKLESHYAGAVADEWSKEPQVLEYFVSTEASELVILPIEYPADEHGWPRLPDGRKGFISFPILYPMGDELEFLEIPVEVTLENAASFVAETRMAQNVAFVTDITPLL